MKGLALVEAFLFSFSAYFLSFADILTISLFDICFLREENVFHRQAETPSACDTPVVVHCSISISIRNGRWWGVATVVVHANIDIAEMSFYRNEPFSLMSDSHCRIEMNGRKAVPDKLWKGLNNTKKKYHHNAP